MVNKFKEKSAPKSHLPKMTSAALKGKQSVRTSFKLSEACIQAINIVAKQLEIKHRSLFDYLIEDTDTLERIAQKIVRGNQFENKGIQKSFIISRESLVRIDHLCEKLKISRDALIELSVRRLLQIIEKEMENHRKRKDMLELVQNHYHESKQVLNRIKASVGAEDTIYKVFQNTVSASKQAKIQLIDILSKGKVIEGFDPSSLKEEL
jgi:hypothetical protein